ncbi:ABC-type nitrate/sulfonate/bicarbonate transport system, periplasmic component [Longilinea arvoryzae]|uniref:ABC-type nitrate/sulfonate/bicarbonate transport system, periplasmic component n=1 Tax=Longilinea arvoryzae TaxID=360412 RepID=A0A0S7BNI7_9CHLR|nr:ABC transporter substrate-binding protein [Longilinea arvoryzae]GAP15579.1 ABC-type nitrate/sulfonate/bicarbonate transport system, periplasmic component [Longilinea arvoryzae]
MNHRKVGAAWPVVLLIFSAILTACQPAAKDATTTVRVARIPVLDTLPLYVAQQEGLFEKHNVKVEIIPVASAPERDQLIAAGQADAMINEVLSTMFANKQSVQMQTVRYARTATATAPVFRILVSKDSGITTLDQLKGVPVGVSDGTIIAYLTERLLQAEGFAPDEIQTTSVPSITDRMALLSSGQLKAAMLPDPLSTLAVQQGATVILADSSHPEYSFSTLTFSKAFLDANPTTVRNFLAAWEDAVALINADGSRWTSLLSDQNLVPAPLLESFKVPQFATAGVPTKDQFQDMLSWAREKGLLTQDVSYSDCVDGQYLPK